MKQRVRLILLSSAFASFTSLADIYITPWVGYTAGGEVKDQDGTDYRIRGSESGAVSIESDFDDGRIGFFYAYQSSKVKQLSVDVKMNYLHFQSSLHYELNKDVYSYMGLGIGGSYVDTDWMRDYGFSASIFGGFEYRMLKNLYLNGQLRWLGTSVDGQATGACTSSSNSCVVQFKTDWVNQYSTNLGLTLTF
ncbi:porin family protein [Vibrio sinus]|uniref:porin family protein n=1 Tax=Vibrio sinus TaxID=2946865 RepID=UPI003D701767